MKSAQSFVQNQSRYDLQPNYTTRLYAIDLISYGN